MLDFVVDTERCTRCGTCVLDCPVRIIEMEDDAFPSIKPEDEADCMQCQHCLAVCPTAAVSILGRKPDASLLLDPKALPTLESLSLLVRGRRSFRNYEQANVDPGLLDQLLKTVANAPSGVNSRRLTFHVIDDYKVMKSIKTRVLQAVLDAYEGGTLPPQSAYLQSVAARYFKGTRDILFRGAPHALIISAPPDAPCGHEDLTLALAYFELLAQSAGLGTVWWGLLKMALESLPELRSLFGIPEGHHYYGMLFGYPFVKYVRTVQRDDAAPVVRITGE